MGDQAIRHVVGNDWCEPYLLGLIMCKCFMNILRSVDSLTNLDSNFENWSRITGYQDRERSKFLSGIDHIQRKTSLNVSKWSNIHNLSSIISLSHVRKKRGFSIYFLLRMCATFRRHSIVEDTNLCRYIRSQQSKATSWIQYLLLILLLSL